MISITRTSTSTSSFKRRSSSRHHGWSMSTAEKAVRLFLIGVGLVTVLMDIYVSRSLLTAGKGRYDSPSTGGKDAVLAYLREAGVDTEHLSNETLSQLPTMEQVVQQHGSRPVIYLGQNDDVIDSLSSVLFSSDSACTKFQNKVPEERRMLGAAGMFSTGTNLVTHLLKQNCYFQARLKLYSTDGKSFDDITKEKLGMRWQVPWGKHTDARDRDVHSTEKAKEINKDDVLPIVTIRNPWRWMASMCANPYAARWRHFRQCPNLLEQSSTTAENGSDNWNNVTVKYGVGPRMYPSLVHLWNEWYNAYKQHAEYPFIIIRMEDLVFHTKETITAVCECAGGRIRDDRKFVYVVDSAKKDSPGHDTTTGLAEAWIKYSKPLAANGGFEYDDYRAALKALDHELIDLFHYSNPLPKNGI